MGLAKLIENKHSENNIYVVLSITKGKQVAGSNTGKQTGYDPLGKHD